MTVNMTFVIEPTDKKFESHHWMEPTRTRWKRGV